MEKSIEQLLLNAAHAERADIQAEQYRDGENDLVRIDAAEARADLFTAVAASLRVRREEHELVHAERPLAFGTDVAETFGALSFPAPDTKVEPEGIAIVHVAVERDGCLWKVTAKRGLDAQVCEGDTLPSLISAAVIAVSVGSPTKPTPLVEWAEVCRLLKSA